MDQKIEELTKKLEAQQVLTEALQFKSFFNQPDTFSISSRNVTTAPDAFYQFTARLPRNVLQPKGIQLTGINFPQATGTSFNDVELVFYYYRLKTHEGFNPSDAPTVFSEAPSINNMYVVRLLPSYYKQELIPNSQLFGFNKTFNTYQELSDELAKCCANDLAVRNGSTATMPFIANDISIVYNETLNKFQMRGNATGNQAWTPPDYVTSQVYNRNDLVSYFFGIIYISLIDNNTFAPNNPTYWDPYIGTRSYTYMAAGYADPNIPIVSASVTQASEVFDFNYTIYGLLPVLGIPPQPLTIDGLTLNRRLGYTWNGLYATFPLEPYNDFNENNTYFRILFNRLRPLPLYIEIPPDPPALGLEDPPPNNNPYTQYLYTFDGYCNLVYSSILYVYSDIVFSSSLTTEKTTLGLLATVPISCATLGIAFEKQFLDNQLHKINNVVENITIELRDERNLPYYCGNNSIVTLSFLATY